MTRTGVTKSKVKRAGRILACRDAPEEERHWAFGVADIWRSAHKEVIGEMEGTLRDLVSRELANGGNNTLVVSRLKRMDTIVKKLQRPDLSMKLNEMNDIAGCRVIVPTERDVYRIVTAVRDARVRLYRTKDYIRTPKDDGYRSVHLITRHDVPSVGLTGLFCETQVRTELQHAWASALETYDVICQQGMKFGGGTYEEKRFFALVAALFAEEECASESGEVIGALKEQREELRRIEDKMSILKKLRACSGSVTILGGEDYSYAGYFVLDIDYELQCTRLYAYPEDEGVRAEQTYFQKERKKGDFQDVLLVKAFSLQNLCKAYPNYSLNICKFLDLANHFVAGEDR